MAQQVRNPPTMSKMEELRILSLGRRKWQPTPVFLPEKPHGQRSLVGSSPQDHKELHMAEQLGTHTHTRFSKWPWWEKRASR